MRDVLRPSLLLKIVAVGLEESACILHTAHHDTDNPTIWAFTCGCTHTRARTQANGVSWQKGNFRTLFDIVQWITCPSMITSAARNKDDAESETKDAERSPTEGTHPVSYLLGAFGVDYNDRPHLDGLSPTVYTQRQFSSMGSADGI